MTYPTRRESSLTGRVRVRAGFRKKLVLQVEIRTVIYSACPRRPGSTYEEWEKYIESTRRTEHHWRDATWDDMQALPRFDLVPAGAIEPAEPWPRR